jgi:hypothetical protein
MAVANTLAYYVTSTITAVKSFIVQAPGSKFFSLLLTKNVRNNGWDSQTPVSDATTIL